MANLLHGSRLRTFGIHNLGGRNYDYTEVYAPDKPGEEAEENARVWYVYLDEAESHDVDMIEGYRSIIDSLLVFAALFSAVVTTFVAQTSQALQPDNAQITVSLLVENNQLLRAAGNRTRIDSVPAASLGPESQTHTSIDVWVNGLFFTSLALSLSTALLSVLARQWIQAYTVIVPGSAKTRAVIRQFRFGGTEKYKLGDIIQSLPLILHCSVAIFLVGLALYVSQLSRPISGIVSVIAALTFLFYFGSSMIPALDIACPYRIPFVFYSTKLLLYAVYTTGYTCRNLCYMLTRCWKPWQSWRPLWLPGQSLKMAEHNKVLQDSHFLADDLAHNSFGWLFNHSSNHSVKHIVIEGTCGLLDEWSPSENSPLLFNKYSLAECLNLLPSTSRNPSSGNTYLSSAILYSLSRLPDTCSASSMEDEIGKTRYGQLIETLMNTFGLKTLLDEPIAGFQDWQERIRDALSEAYDEALRDRHHVLSRWLLDLGGPNLFQNGGKSSKSFLRRCVYHGDAEDFHELVHRGIDLDDRDYNGWDAMHDAVRAGNLDVAITLVEREPAMISVPKWHLSFTVLESAIQSCSPNSHTMVIYLLDHGAQSFSHNALYNALTDYKRYTGPEKVKLLLDCGWDRTIEDAEGKTLLEVSRSKGNGILVEYLEHYQTVRLAPYGTTSHTVNEETP